MTDGSTSTCWAEPGKDALQSRRILALACLVLMVNAGCSTHRLSSVQSRRDPYPKQIHSPQRNVATSDSGRAGTPARTDIETVAGEEVQQTVVQPAALTQLPSVTGDESHQTTVQPADSTVGEDLNSEKSPVDNGDVIPMDHFEQGIPEWMSSYIIESGDTLEIKFRTARDLNEQVVVRPDGMITLQIVGDLMVRGYSPVQVRESLIQMYSAEIKEPELVVIVRTFAGNTIYVGGEVNAASQIPLSSRVTTLQAIILAGGFKDTANQKKVIVRHEDGSSSIHNLKGAIDGSINGQDIVLNPHDVVYVPKSHIAKVNQFVDQYIEKVIPFQRSAGVFISQNIQSGSVATSP